MCKPIDYTLTLTCSGGRGDGESADESGSAGSRGGPVLSQLSDPRSVRVGRLLLVEHDRNAGFGHVGGELAGIGFQIREGVVVDRHH